MKAVHILGRVHQIQATLAVQTLGQGQLQQNPVTGSLFKKGDGVFQLGLRDVRRQPEALGNDAHVLAGPLLVADIDLGCGMVPDQDNRQTRCPAMSGRYVSAVTWSLSS